MTIIDASELQDRVFQIVSSQAAAVSVLFQNMTMQGGSLRRGMVGGTAALGGRVSDRRGRRDAVEREREEQSGRSRRADEHERTRKCIGDGDGKRGPRMSAQGAESIAWRGEALGGGLGRDERDTPGAARIWSTPSF